MAVRGKSARTKGNAYERQIAKELRELNLFPNVVTSRSESRNTDSKKIDLCFTEPFNIQCKDVEKSRLAHDILAEMPQGSNYNLVFDKRSRKGEVVCMMKSDFYELLEMLIRNHII